MMPGPAALSALPSDRDAGTRPLQFPRRAAARGDDRRQPRADQRPRRLTWLCRIVPGDRHRPAVPPATSPGSSRSSRPRSSPSSPASFRPRARNPAPRRSSTDHVSRVDEADLHALRPLQYGLLRFLVGRVFYTDAIIPSSPTCRSSSSTPRWRRGLGVTPARSPHKLSCCRR